MPYRPTYEQAQPSWCAVGEMIHACPQRTMIVDVQIFEDAAIEASSPYDYSSADFSCILSRCSSRSAVLMNLSAHSVQ